MGLHWREIPLFWGIPQCIGWGGCQELQRWWEGTAGSQEHWDAALELWGLYLLLQLQTGTHRCCWNRNEAYTGWEGHLPNALQACWARRAKTLQPPCSWQQRLLARAQCSELARNFPTGWMENADFEEVKMFCGEYVDFSEVFFVMESRRLSQVTLPGVWGWAGTWGTQGAQALLSLLKHQGRVMIGQNEGKMQWFSSLKENLMWAVEVACLCVCFEIVHRFRCENAVNPRSN